VPKFAIIENAKVTNVIMANSKTFAKKIGYAVEVTAATGEPFIGFEYLDAINKFVPSSPFESWTLNREIAEWEAPTAVPKGGNYTWDEETKSWVADDRIDAGDN